MTSPVIAEEVAVINNEDALKVAFLYNFALYTEWPMPLGEGLTLCIVGGDALGAAFDALANRPINGKPIILRRIDSRADLGRCHLVYLSSTVEAKSDKLLLDLKQKPVLSVTDATGANGNEFSMISLNRDGNRLVFDINNTKARAAGVVLSSKLLRLARSVH